MPRIYILSGPDIGKSVEVEDGATLGRATECIVHLRDASVSRHHARVERSEEGWRIVDTQSRNGVHVRGERVRDAALSDGEEFRVGEVEMRFRLAPGERTPKPAPELEEIALEEEPAPATEPVPVPARISAPPAALAPERAERTATPIGREERIATDLDPTVLSASRPGVPELRGARILQYKRIPDREGFFASDLAQQPQWIKVGATLLALLVFAAIFLFAFKGTSILKARASGGSAEAPAESGR